ncbi:MAG: LicD family protein [Butyrivibrio sp.]|nr:LicD family protein [Butyrivibrio sp.]
MEFTTDNTTKQIQDTIIKILKSFAGICEKHNLRYYLIDGSMLGAIRHHGFIPWDDDLDIAMPREDYEKFCKIAAKELPGNMYFVSYEESLKGKSLGEISQIYCTDLKVEMDYFSETKDTDVWMDVMIMYGMPGGKLRQRMHFFHYYLIKGIARMGRIKNVGGKKYGFVEKTAIALAKAIDLSRIIDTEKMLLKSVKVLKKYPYDSSESLIVVPSEYGKNEIVPKNYYEGGRKEKFEDLEASVPAEAEKVLTKLYGDYMEFPPVEKRKSKHKVRIIGSKQSE